MATEKPPRSPYRKTSLTAGILYLVTFVSLPSLALYGPARTADYVLGDGPDTAAVFGGLLEVTVALACIGTAVVLFPVLKKQNEAAALGLVAARILEATAIIVGVSFILTVVSLRQSGDGPEALANSSLLVHLYDRIFLLSQSFMPAICDLLLGIVLYRSRLVPRALSFIGIIGAPVLIAGYLAVMFGLLAQRDALAALSALFVAVFELSLGIWLIAKGFNRQAVAALDARQGPPAAGA